MRVNGSYTVEAVFLFPIILFLVIFILQISISWYQSAYTASEDIQQVLDLDTQDYFYKARLLDEIVEIFEP